MFSLRLETSDFGDGWWTREAISITGCVSPGFCVEGREGSWDSTDYYDICFNPGLVQFMDV